MVYISERGQRPHASETSVPVGHTRYRGTSGQIGHRAGRGGRQPLGDDEHDKN